MSFNRNIFLRPLALIIGFFTIMVLSACSFAPLYSGTNINTQSYEFSFDQANSRLEQIVYSELVAALGRSTNPDSRRVNIVVSSSNITPGSSSVGLSGKITVTDQITGDIIFSGTRTASATYISSEQLLTNQQAANEASERAARQLAQTIRLTLLGIAASITSP